MGRALDEPVASIKKIGVNMFAVGVGSYVSDQELKLIASDPDETHVFYVNSFNDFNSWIDKISSVSCDGMLLLVPVGNELRFGLRSFCFSRCVWPMPVFGIFVVASIAQCSGHQT